MNSSHLDTSRPTATYTPTTPRPQTLSLALPASLISNSKRKLDLRTSLAGSISRALSVFCVDEITIFSDGDFDPFTEDASGSYTPNPDPSSTKLTAFTHPSHFLAYILSYQETPPFMRSRLFPMHQNLEKVGILPSVDIPSHLRATEWCAYREGVVMRSAREGTYVDCGLPRHRLVKGVEIPVKTRVTLRMGGEEDDVAEVVAPDTPRSEGGYYWGYQVREARSLSAVFTECPFDGGYDLSFGTSERGLDVRNVEEEVVGSEKGESWQHMILVFGGVKGLEEAAANDEELLKLGIGRENVGDLFDYWVNLLPGQGSRTIRTEEAVWMGLMGLRRVVEER